MAATDDRTVRLLENDPELARSLRPERRAEAVRTALARVESIDRGTWDTANLPYGEAPTYGLLVLDGLLARTILLRDVAAAQLLGHGDLIPAPGTGPQPLVTTAVRWTVLEPATVAVLDARLLLTIRRWPEVVAALFERVTEQATRLDTQRALCHLPRVEDRLHAVLWFLAERWGRVTPQGVILPLRLTHELLGQLVGAKRPTVSLAVRALDEAGMVHRRDDGVWLLERTWTAGPPSTREVAGGGAVIGDARPPEDTAEGHHADADPVAVPVAPSEADVAVTTRRDLDLQVERMQDLHERVSRDVVAALERSLLARSRSAALRERMGANRGAPNPRRP